MKKNWISFAKNVASAWRARPIKENVEFGAFDVGIDNDEDQYRSLSQTSRDLSPHKYERSVRISQGFYETNPLYKRIINFPLEAITSAGFACKCEDSKVQERWKDFWSDNLTGFRNLLLGVDGLLREELLTGELNLPVGFFPNGDMDIGFIDPLNIKNIAKAPGNALRDEKVILKADPGHDERVFDIVQVMGGQVFGDLFRFTMNRPVNAKRGKPVHMSILDHIDLSDQAVFNDLERYNLLKMFIWNLSTKATPSEVKELQTSINKEGGMNPGSIRVTDESSKWEAVTPDLKSADATEFHKLMRGFIGGVTVGNDAALGFGSDINVATMRELMKFVVWIIEGIQREVITILTTIFKFQLQIDVAMGRMTNEGQLLSSDDLTFKITANKVVKREFVIQAAGFESAVSSIISAKDSKLISTKTAQEIFVMAANEFGFELDLQEVQDSMEEEKPEVDQFGSVAADAQKIANGKTNGNGFTNQEVIKF